MENTVVISVLHTAILIALLMGGFYRKNTTTVERCPQIPNRVILAKPFLQNRKHNENIEKEK